MRRNGHSPSLDRVEALHRQPVELQREDVGEQVADHEDRRGEAEHREHHHPAIDPGAVLPGRHHAQRDGDYDREDNGEHHQRQRRLDTLRYHVRDRQVGEDRGAEVAVQDLPQPFAEADQEGAIKTERGADALDVGGGGLVAGDDGGRIAGGDVEQAEDEEGDHQHDRDGGQNAPDGIGEHALGHSRLGLRVCRRGWRHAAKLPTMHRLNCPRFAGFLIAAPGPAAQPASALWKTPGPGTEKRGALRARALWQSVHWDAPVQHPSDCQLATTRKMNRCLGFVRKQPSWPQAACARSAQRRLALSQDCDYLGCRGGVPEVRISRIRLSDWLHDILTTWRSAVSMAFLSPVTLERPAIVRLSWPSPAECKHPGHPSGTAREEGNRARETTLRWQWTVPLRGPRCSLCRMEC